MDSERPVQVYCFHPAGAGVSVFQRWGRLLAPGVEVIPVLLPGRDRRRAEQRIATAAELGDELRRLMLPRLTTPYVLYGHSLGGLVAMTAAAVLREAGYPDPALVAVSGCAPPHAPVPLLDARLADDELVDRLIELSMIPGPVPARGVWCRGVLPVLRDDLRLAAALRAATLQTAALQAAASLVPSPLLAIAGRADPVASAEVMAGWRQWAGGRFALRTLPGDHLFVRGPELPRLLRRFCLIIERALAGAH
jgi:surfactin synthase thioesterase subunit